EPQRRRRGKEVAGQAPQRLIGHVYYPGGGVSMAVTGFQDFDLADADREWDGDAADKRVRKWADAEDAPNAKYRAAHVWYDADNKDTFTAYKLLICDVVKGRLLTVPRAVMAAGGIMQGARGVIDI